MDIRQLSEKADYIASKHQRLQAQWKQYSNTLVQGITLAKAKLYHSLECRPDDELRFFLFNHFVIHIRPGEGFHNPSIEYLLETADGSDNIMIAKVIMDEEGCIEGRFSNRDREAVLTHYLALIRPVYDTLYRAVQENIPVSIEQLRLAAMA